MKVLMAHNQYQLRGGEDESTDMESALLVSRGHEVVRLADHNDRIKRMPQLKAAVASIWNQAAYRTTVELIRRHRPDVMHVQNFFPLLSPAIHHAAQSEGIPVVQSLRNYRLLCLNALFFRDGHPCQECLGAPLMSPGIRHRCYRGSAKASSAVAASVVAHRALGTWRRKVNVFIALSDFVRQTFIDAGWDPARIVVKPNFVFPDPGAGSGEGGFALLAGRLSAEKGIRTTIEAWRTIGSRIPLKIVGDGPLAPMIAQEIADLPSVQWLGRKPLKDLYDLMGRAAVVVFPSESYESFGRIAIEAFAKGTPVIAARIGGLAELVRSGENGYAFTPGDSEDLSRQVIRLLEDKQALRAMRNNARQNYLAQYSADANLQQLLAIYHSAMDKQESAPRFSNDTRSWLR